MKFIRYEKESKVYYGIVENDTVTEMTTSPFEPYQLKNIQHPLSKIKILPPCEPTKIFALAGNFRNHLGDKRPPQEPKPFLKVTSSVIPTGETIELPKDQPRIEEEAELVVVIGKRCRKVSAEETLQYVLGYTCGNDVSAREWQKNDQNWWRAKSSDTFSPLGPFIATDIDGARLEILARINGTEVQHCNTADMIFDIPYLISFLSRSVTLEPGDLIFTGTSGVPAQIHDGDTVEIEIENIGILKNPVRMERA